MVQWYGMVCHIPHVRSRLRNSARSFGSRRENEKKILEQIMTSHHRTIHQRYSQEEIGLLWWFIEDRSRSKVIHVPLPSNTF